MSKNERIRYAVAAIINAVIGGLAIYCFVSLLKSAMNGNNRFIYFTNISNLTVGLVALVNAVFLALSLVKNKNLITLTMSVVKIVAVSMTTLTFFTVLFVIGPVDGYAKNYSGRNFLTHLVIPLLALISLLFLEERMRFRWPFSLFALIPLGIYSVFYIVNVVVLGSWPDIYLINKQGLWYLFLIAFLVADFGLIQGMYFLNRRIRKNTEKND